MTRTPSGTADAERVPRDDLLPAALRRHGVLIIALLFIVVHLGWRFAVLRQAYFRQDDFEYIARASEHPLDWDYLMRSHSGQLMPGGFALVWVLTRLSPYNWELTSAVTMVLQAGAALAMLRMFRVLFGNRPAILLPLAVYLFTPMAVPAFAWWAAALNAVPLQIAMPMAVASHVRYVRTGRPRDALMATGWIVFGLAFFLKAAAIPVLLLVITCAYLVTDRPGPDRPASAEDRPAGRRQPPLIRALALTLSRYRAAWAMYGIVLAGYAPVYLITLSGASGTSGTPAADDTTTFAGRWLGRTFSITSVGGPGEWFTVKTGDYAVAESPTVWVGVAWLIIAVVIGVTSWYRRGGWRAWAILAGWLLGADVLPVVFGRLNAYFAPILGLEARYLADVAPVLTICLALAAIPVVGERDAYRRPVPPGWLHPATITVAGGLYVGVSLWSTSGYLTAIDAEPVRAYMRNAREALSRAPADAVVYDQGTPHHIYWSLAGEYSRTRHVLAPLARPEMRRTMSGGGALTSTERPLVFDGTGRLRAATVVGSTADPPLGGCWPQQGGVVTVPVRPPGKGGGWTAQVGYLSGQPARVRVEYGGRPVDVTLHKGLGQITFPVGGRGGSLVMTPFATTSGLCVGKVTVGAPVAR